MAWAAIPFVLVLIASAPHLAVCVSGVLHQTALNYNEGWNAYHAVAVFGDAPLYPAAGSLFPNNYPPLSFAIVGALGHLTGDPIFAGRWISLVSFLWLALQIGVQVAALTGSRSSAALASLLFVAWMLVGYGDYVGIDDPQILAHALMASGLTLLLRRRTPGRIAASALLVGLGALVKHNLIALPLAIALWLWRCERRALWRWLLFGAGLAAASAVGLGLLHGWAVFQSLAAPRGYDPVRALSLSQKWLAPLVVPLAPAIATLGALGPRDPVGYLTLRYVAIALVAGVLLSGGAGVHYNAFFDLVIALALASGWALARIDRRTGAWRGPARVTLALVLAANVLVAAPEALRTLPAGLEALRLAEAATREDIARLSAEPGSALCETLALCFWARKAPEVDLFNARQAFLSGVADEERLLERLRRRDFALVQLAVASSERDDERVSPAFMATLEAHYLLERRSPNGGFFRAR